MENLRRRAEKGLAPSNSSFETNEAMPEKAPVPAVGKFSFGDFWRLDPVSRDWGNDRGDPIDRFYIEAFLQRHCADIRGRILEAGGNTYTKRFGGDQVTQSDIVDVRAECKQATIIADLAKGDGIASDSFDCLILTQVLQYIFDVHAAIRTIERILKPGGTLLLTVPGISQINLWEDPSWSMTVTGVRRLLMERFPPESVSVESRGNVLTATAFLQGLSQQDIGDFAYQADDPHYPLTVLARAMKPAHKIGNATRATELTG
jgi:SAM-dependent methyltransferase